jgi:phenylacetate-coenzyme A ligase PaaK-like adenylate-forming protein
MSLTQSVYYSMPVPAQNALVSAYGYYLKYKRQHPSGRKLREMVAASRSWSRQEVSAYQTRQLVQIITQCGRAVPYYRDLFAKAGIEPAKFQALTDLQRIPLLPKDTVRRERTHLMAQGASPYWIQHTSGSTGTPVVVHVDQRTYQLVDALLTDHEATCGVASTDLRATFAGRMVQPAENLTPPFWRYNHAGRQILFSAYHLSEQTLPAYVAELARRNPAELIGYPSAIATVAAHITASGQRGVVRPRVVITNSETLFAWQREIIESAFACPVMDYYGSAETVVFAPQCGAGAYHFSPLLGIAEIVDEAGQPAPPGQVGKLVCTTLSNHVMPLVRYAIGDDAVRLEGPCACGSALDGAREIIGRHDDTIMTPDGRSVGRMDHIFKGVTGIQECQIVQEARDLVRLVLVADAEFDARQETLLRHNARVRLTDAVRVEISRVKEIPRSRAGKFRGVVSRLDRRSDH